jgi:outer membrane protein OmpA-like peptidoglycan-associated protein
MLRILLCAIAAALMTAVALPAQAQVSKDEIVRGLKPSESLTRGLTRGIGTTRKIEIVPGKEAEVLDQNKDLPKLNLTIEFEYASDKPTRAGEQQLVALGEALKDSSLKGFRFMLAGHTDARGSDDYNLALSERRAIAVQRYLMTNQIDPSRLNVVGFGKKRLLDAGNPESSRNRRVEIVNLLN